jgi:hypothetical protein
MDTPQRADTRPARDPAKLPKGWTEHPLGELPRPALTGAMLDDRFEVKGRLGEGGMADLYLGADRLCGAGWRSRSSATTRPTRARASCVRPKS